MRTVKAMTLFRNSGQLLFPGLWQMSVAGGTATATESPPGKLNLTGDGTNAARGDQAITTLVGRTYQVRFTVLSSNVDEMVGTTQGGTNIVASTSFGSGARVLNFIATSTLAWVRFSKTPAALSGVTQIGAVLR